MRPYLVQTSHSVVTSSIAILFASLLLQPNLILITLDQTCYPSLSKKIQKHLTRKSIYVYRRTLEQVLIDDIELVDGVNFKHEVSYGPYFNVQ